MKLLDLFSGICGFSHAAEKYGFFTTAFCEIDNFRHRVIQYHYPGKPIYTDIRNVDGKKIEPVNIVTFGSPCQNLSVAGKREGLKGKESCLFYEAIRIIREMREKTGGLYPRYAVWENVPGAFSSSKGQDFKAVLEAFLETEIPMPESGRWANAGMVRGDGRSVAWRVMDAQYWGVPQRRRRIFLVADFKRDEIYQLLSGTKEDGTIPRYVVPGLVRTKAIYMSDMVAKLTAEFSKEKNVTQREVMEGALIEYLQKYGFKREVESLLKNQ